MKCWSPIAVACLVSLFSACDRSSSPTPRQSTSSPTALSRDLRLKIFGEVASTLATEYYDSTFHGVDWAAVTRRYRNSVDTAETDLQFYRLLEIFVAELNDAHTVFQHPQQAAAPDEGPRGSVGISLSDVEGKTVIMSVDGGSDAALAGVKPGMTLRTVNGKSVEQLYDTIRSKVAGSSSSRATRNLMHTALLYGGFIGSSRTFGVEGFDGKTFDVPIRNRAAFREDTVTARRLRDGYGYISFTSWIAPVDSRFNAAIARLRDTPGLIIDLRGNGGGNTDVLLTIASNFFQSPALYGGFRARNGIVQQYSTRRVPNPYLRPIVILVDEMSASASESFTAFMQESGRARVVGRPTCGCTLNQRGKQLTGGGVLRWSYRAYVSPHGRNLEGIGVGPDVVVPLSLADIRYGKDGALEAAIRELATLGRHPQPS